MSKFIITYIGTDGYKHCCTFHCKDKRAAILAAHKHLRIVEIVKVRCKDV